MYEKEIKITADVKDAKRDINSLLESIEKNTADATKEVNALKEDVSEIGDNSKKSVKGVESLGKSFKGLGLAIKALGIGLLLKGIELVGEIFSRNQRVVDFFGTVFEGMSIVVNDFINFILDNAGGVVDVFKDIFENPAKHVANLGQLIKENLIERFQSLLEAAGFLGDAFKKLFEGDFAGAFESAKEAGLEMVDVMTGVDDTVGRVTQGVTDIAEAASEYAKNTIKAAKANVELRNTAELAAAQQGLLIAKLEGQAEAQRRIRDDESLSIEKRIEANNKLLEITKESNEALKKQADLQIQAAEAALETNGRIENEIALTDALKNKKELLNQIQAQQIEQNVNKVALQREEIELNETLSEGEKERQLAQLEFEAELEQNEILKLEKLKERFELENEQILEDLEKKRELYALGTQARIDAENDYLNRKQEIDNQITLNELAQNKAREKDSETTADAKLKIEESNANDIVNLLSSFSDESKELQAASLIASNATGIAKNIIDTNASNARLKLELGIAAEPLIAANFVRMGTGIAASVAATVKGLAALGKGGDASGGGGANGGAPPPAPSFNLVEGTESNQIANSLQGSNEPVRAYVVAGDVTTAQQANRNIIEGSRI